MKWVKVDEDRGGFRGWAWMTVTLPSSEIRLILAAGLMMQVAGVFAILQGFYLEDNFSKILGFVCLVGGTLVVKVRYRYDHEYHRYSYRDGEFFCDDFRIREGDCPIWDSEAEPAWIAVQERLRTAEATLDSARTEAEVVDAQATYDSAIAENDHIVQGLQDFGLQWRPEDD